MTTTYKIHPAIGVARVGNSSDYYLAPTTAAGLPTEPSSGQPVQNFRDAAGALRRQAARFQIYVYDDTTPNGRLLELGRDGVVDVEWTVHVANKKSAWYEFQQLQGVSGYDSSHTPRNKGKQGQERNTLITDPGPRTVTCQSATTATFDSASAPTGSRRAGRPPGPPSSLNSPPSPRPSPATSRSLRIADSTSSTPVDLRRTRLTWPAMLTSSIRAWPRCTGEETYTRAMGQR